MKGEMSMATTWHNCYSEGWQNEIVPEAFSHPAKFSRGLIRRIYAHALAQGYLKPGDWVADCFAGVGLGAADALALGLNWFGNELEQNFVDLGAGCDCTGISKDDWVACFGRWKRFAHKDGRHWCPRCLAEAGGVIEPRPPTLPGMDPDPTASYERNSGKIPYTRPHRYAGNLDLFARHARNGATAVLVQGDSRNLVKVLEGARAEGLISSPPFGQAQSGGGIVITGTPKTGKLSKTGGYRADMAGTDPLNLGNMPTGEPPSAMISSPPLGKAQSGGTSFWEGLEEKHGRTFSDKVREGSQGYREDQLGDSEGQLGTMPTGEPLQAILSSPPFAHDTEPHGDLRPDDGRAMRRTAERSYGASNGQLAAMREGDAPTDYTYTPGSLTPTQFDAKAVVESITFTQADKPETIEMKQPPGAIISSPPWTSTSACEDPNYRTDRQASGGPLYNDYGNSDGQLAALPEGEPPQVDACISSPPYEGSLQGTAEAQRSICDTSPPPGAIRKYKRKPSGYGYSISNDNLGNQQGDTFWSAARAILDQCHAVLAPGGVAIWVLKAFVRNKAIVDFPGQWEALCNSCGLETVEVIRTHLVEDRGEQFALNGDLVKRKVRRFSFFRRLHVKKYPHLAINWEIVLITRKGVA